MSPTADVLHWFRAVTETGGHLGWVSPPDVLGAPAVHSGVVEFFAAVLSKSKSKGPAAQPEAAEPAIVPA